MSRSRAKRHQGMRGKGCRIAHRTGNYNLVDLTRGRNHLVLEGCKQILVHNPRVQRHQWLEVSLHLYLMVEDKLPAQ